jgi:hypothetical protein
VLEHICLALNLRGTLYLDKALIQITNAAGNTAVFKNGQDEAGESALGHRIHSCPGRAVARSRGWPPSPAKPGARPPRPERPSASAASHTSTSSATSRNYPAREEFFTAAPAVVETKARFGTVAPQCPTKRANISGQGYDYQPRRKARPRPKFLPWLPRSQMLGVFESGVAGPTGGLLHQMR